MTTTLLVEPFGGMAGDMLLAALLDLADPRFTLADLRALADALVPGEHELRFSETRRGGLRASTLEVRTPESGHAPHRHLPELRALLEGARLPAPVVAGATACLERIAAAEARVHGIPAERVAFHEVGAVDTLIDVCGAALALHRLEVGRARFTPPLVGSGTVRCAHGEMPVPAPGTAELLRGVAHVRGGAGERLTPTGAALLVAFAEPLGAGEALALDAARIGYGAGRADFDEGPPNLVRVVLGRDEAGAPARREAWLGEINVDDATGEELGFCLQELRAHGALECWSSAAQMKKDRPAAVLSVLCRDADRAAIERVAFAHTPTLGVRWTRVERTELEREERVVSVRGRRVRVKVRRRPRAGGEAPELGALDLSPEFDDLAALARELDVPLRALEAEAIEAARAADH